MPDDQNTTQNPISTENSIPPSSSAVAESSGETKQEPVADMPVSAIDSTPAEIPPEAPEFPKNADIPVSLNNPSDAKALAGRDNPENVPVENLPPEGGKTKEMPLVLSESAQTSETRTAQIPVNEPLKSESEPLGEPVQQKAEATPPPVPTPGAN